MKLKKYNEWDKSDKIAFFIGVIVLLLLMPIGMIFRTDGNYWVDIYMSLSTIPVIYIILAMPMEKRKREGDNETI